MIAAVVALRSFPYARWCGRLGRSKNQLNPGFLACKTFALEDGGIIKLHQTWGRGEKENLNEHSD